MQAIREIMSFLLMIRGIGLSNTMTQVQVHFYLLFVALFDRYTLISITYVAEKRTRTLVY